MRSLMLAAAAAVLPAAVCAQQGQTPGAQAGTALPPLIEVKNDGTVVPPFGLTVDQLEDMDVEGPDGEQIGEIDEVLMTPQGEIMAVSVDVGGFLGIGGEEVIIRLDQLRRLNDKFAVDMTEDELEALPIWDD